MLLNLAWMLLFMFKLGCFNKCRLTSRGLGWPGPPVVSAGAKLSKSFHLFWGMKGVRGVLTGTALSYEPLCLMNHSKDGKNSSGCVGKLKWSIYNFLTLTKYREWLKYVPSLWKLIVLMGSLEFRATVIKLVFAANYGSWEDYVIMKAENLVIYIYVIWPEPFLCVCLSNAVIESTQANSCHENRRCFGGPCSGIFLLLLRLVTSGVLCVEIWDWQRTQPGTSPEDSEVED